MLLFVGLMFIINAALGLALLPAAGVMVGLTLSARDTSAAGLRSLADLLVASVIGRSKR